MSNNTSKSMRRNPSAWRDHPDMMNWTGHNTQPPGWVFDAIAERTMNAGYTLKKNPVCPDCHTQRSRSGACMC
jgi:hypothetical protein